MSDSENMSSPYVVPENRSLDQWKVTELKEELKRRKLITKGLKDDLVKRLDEAIRAEMEESEQNHDNGVNQPEVPPDNATVEPVVTEENIDKNESLKENIENDNVAENLDNKKRDDRDVDDGLNSSGKKMVLEGSVETSVEVLQNVEMINKEEVLNLQQEDEESKREVKPNIGSQVVEVSEVKSESICIATVSNTEKNEVKDDSVIADDVKLEQQHDVVDGDAKTETVVVVDEKDAKKSDSGEIGSPEKLNLDRSSGDDSMEEDAIESKQIESKFVSHEISEKTQVNVDDVMVEDTPKNTETIKDKTDPNPSVGSTQRKLHGDQEATINTEAVKRQRRWNSAQQTTNSSVSATPKGSSHAKNSFSRSNSSVSNEEPKERVVPPSSKPATTSLRIDRFLRPFTLKAVQELLGKTGTVVDFWMDHIKTHCYVTYSSVEEAIETRNAVYNLQWPANGGRLLMAEFVDPSEVKSRTEAPLPSPVTPQPPPTATQPPLHQLPPPPPLPLPPPPPLSMPPHSREPALPPPPPLPRKTEPPIMTLDDLFRKTRATPRIYYLPLSDEQVAAKLNSEKGKVESSREK